ncbi:hypothetical protein PO902_09755 [Planococcus maritimus]|nr:hypothetical protein [Planococcus sp. SK3692]MDE4085306.1 hypothetical protein [Planococcus maritimus]
MFKSYVATIEKYRSFIIAFNCLIVLIISWGDNWILTWIMLAGVIICPLIGISDLKQARIEQESARSAE